LDIPRPPAKKRGRYVLAGAVVVGVVVLTAGLSRLEPAVPTVDRATLWIDTVQQGTFVRDVHGPGTLEPEQVFQVAAVTGGRVEQLPVKPGAKLTDTTLIVVLSNPDVQLQLLNAQQQVSQAESALLQLRATLQSSRLTQQGTVASLRSAYEEAKSLVRVDSALDKKGLLSTNDLRNDTFKLQAAETQLRAAERQLALMDSTADEQITLQKQQIERLRGIARFNEQQIASMQVRAGHDGTLTELPLELGEYVTSGTMLAKIAQPGRLKAVLKIPETQVTDVTLGQPVSVDTRNGIAKGKVMRIYPSSDAGTVTVEVSFDGELPRGARPQLSVDGTIEIERLKDVVFMGRPAYGQAGSTVGIFRLTPDGKYAERVNVKLGASSVNTIEVKEGLKPGDVVIISDMSNWDSNSRVRLK
jgi:RND family efflux transporter MFP subunit